MLIVPVIETHNLVKRYGKIEALKGVSLQVERGEIYGLLGQNGAGKTTLVKILLDEPTDGVDPLGRREIRALMQRLKEHGKTIFLNSHLLSEVELICDRVGILQTGEMIREGDIPSLTRRRGLFLVGLAPGQAF